MKNFKIAICLAVLSFIPLIQAFSMGCGGEYKWGLDFCYDVDYEIQSCTESVCYSKQDLAEEGEKIIFWPEISVTGFAYSTENKTFYFNETYYPEDLLIVYYFVYPSGERSDRSFIWI